MYTIRPEKFIWQSPCWWCATFVSSNDSTELFEPIMRQMECWKNTEIELISVVGGLKFLDVIARKDFARITLFDKNVNQIALAIAVKEYLDKTPFHKFDHFVGMTEEILRSPALYFLPGIFHICHLLPRSSPLSGTP